MDAGAPNRRSGGATQTTVTNMTKLTLGTLLATVAMFVWGAIFWMNPWPYSVMGRTSDDVATGRTLLEHFPANGTYIIPGLHHPPDQLAALHRAGPLAMVHLKREGAEIMGASTMIQGFVQELVTVLLIAGLLLLAGPSLPSYGTRVRFVGLAGVAVAVFTDLGAPIWWQHPWPFHLVSAVYTVTAWLVAGLVLAAFIRQRPLAPPPSLAPA
jgi:hypothetical protein